MYAHSLDSNYVLVELAILQKTDLWLFSISVKHLETGTVVNLGAEGSS